MNAVTRAHSPLGFGTSGSFPWLQAFCFWTPTRWGASSDRWVPFPFLSFYSRSSPILWRRRIWKNGTSAILWFKSFLSISNCFKPWGFWSAKNQISRLPAEIVCSSAGTFRAPCLGSSIGWRTLPFCRCPQDVAGRLLHVSPELLVHGSPGWWCQDLPA